MSQEILTLALGNEVFAIDAGLVREILDGVPVTHVPSAPAFVDGLINVRGKVVPLADLRLRFGMAHQDATADSRIVVVDIDLGGAPTTVALLADSVAEVTEVEAAQLEEAPRIGMRWNPAFVRGIAKHRGKFIVVLDIERVLGSDEPTRAVAWVH